MMENLTEHPSLTEASQCVFCKKALLGGRLLRCLHNVCLRCVRDEVGGSNAILCPRCGTVTKPPPSGSSQLQTLPNSYNTRSFSGEAKDDDMQIPCDECGGDDSDGNAEAVCTDCGLHLCSFHSTAHKKTRSTRGHAVKALSSSESYMVQKSSCPLHMSQQLELFCEKCGELFCKRCEQLGSHDEHAGSILTVKEAARKLRQDISSKREEAKRGKSGTPSDMTSGAESLAVCRLPESKQLETSLEGANTAISGWNKHVESVSEKVESSFAQVVEVVKKRQQKLIDDLDALRWKILKPLEEQQQRLCISMAASAQIDLLLDRCQSDLDFLRMAPWLQSNIIDIEECLQKDSNVAASSYIILQRENFTEFEVLAGKVGSFVDKALDEKQSRVSCQNTVAVDKEMKIEVEGKAVGGEPVCHSLLKEMNFEMSITPEDNEPIQCELSPGDSAGMLQSLFTPPAPGKYVLSATMDKRHLQGSPCVISVESGYGMGFDPTQIGQYVQLSDNNAKAQMTTRNYVTVRSLSSTSTGTLDFNVRLDTYHASYHQYHITVSNNDENSDFNSHNFSGAFGWNLQSQGSGYGRGMSPATSYSAGDIISVRLDCDRSQVMFVHERTGLIQIIRNLPAGKYYLYICMYTTSSGSGGWPTVSLV